MKKVIVLVAVIIIYSNSFSQSIGVSGALAKMSVSRDITTGYNIDLSIPISTQIEISLNVSYLYKNKSAPNQIHSYSEMPVSIEGKYFFSYGSISPYACFGFGANYLKETNSNNSIMFGSVTSTFAYLINVSFGSYLDLTENIKLNAQLKQYGIISNYEPIPSLNIGLVYKF